MKNEKELYMIPTAHSVRLMGRQQILQSSLAPAAIIGLDTTEDLDILDDDISNWGGVI